MAQLTVYEYPKCGTCRSAIKWLKGKDHELTTHNVFETAPEADVIAELVRKSGLDIKKFFNTSGEVYKELNLKDKIGSMTDEEKIALLASNGRLLKRPVVTDGQKVTVGFKEEQYEQEWS